MVHGCMVYTDLHTKTASVSPGTSHVTANQCCTYTNSVDIQNAIFIIINIIISVWTMGQVASVYEEGCRGWGLSLNPHVQQSSPHLIIIMYICRALINALSAHMIHINLNMIFYTHVEHSPTKTIYIKYYKKIFKSTLHTHCL